MQNNWPLARFFHHAQSQSTLTIVVTRNPNDRLATKNWAPVEGFGNACCLCRLHCLFSDSGLGQREVDNIWLCVCDAYATRMTWGRIGKKYGRHGVVGLEDFQTLLKADKSVEAQATPYFQDTFQHQRYGKHRLTDFEDFQTLKEACKAVEAQTITYFQDTIQLQKYGQHGVVGFEDFQGLEKVVKAVQAQATLWPWRAHGIDWLVLLLCETVV